LSFSSSRQLLDVGDVSAHQFESLRSLIRDIGMFLDLNNVVESSFEIPIRLN